MPQWFSKKTLISALSCMLALGCTKEEKSRLEQMALEAEASTRASFEYATVPDPGPAPEGIDAKLWADLGWVPGTVVELGSLAKGQDILAWARGNAGALHESCTQVLDSIDRYYMIGQEEVQDPEQSQTLLFYGKMDRLTVARCVRSVYSNLGLSSDYAAKEEGSISIFGKNGKQAFLNWAQRGDEFVVVDAPKREHVEHFFAGTKTVAGEPRWTEMMVGEFSASTMLTLARRGLGSVLTKVESTGYRGEFSMAMPSFTPSAKVWFYYASEEEAVRAGEGLSEFLVELDDLGMNFLIHDGVEGKRVGMHFEPPSDMQKLAEIMADPEVELRPVLELLSRRSQEAGMVGMDVETVLGLAKQAAGLPPDAG